MSCARLERGSNLKPSQATRLGPSTRVCVSALPPLVYPRQFHVSDRRPAARLAAAIRVAAPDGRLDADREWRGGLGTGILSARVPPARRLRDHNCGWWGLGPCRLLRCSPPACFPPCRRPASVTAPPPP